jgi:hypothetical protein
MKKTYPSDLNKKAWKYMKKRLPKRQNKLSLKWSWRIILVVQCTQCMTRSFTYNAPTVNGVTYQKRSHPS